MVPVLVLVPVLVPVLVLVLVLVQVQVQVQVRGRGRGRGGHRRTGVALGRRGIAAAAASGHECREPQRGQATGSGVRHGRQG